MRINSICDILMKVKGFYKKTIFLQGIFRGIIRKNKKP